MVNIDLEIAFAKLLAACNIVANDVNPFPDDKNWTLSKFKAFADKKKKKKCNINDNFCL